MSAFRTIEPDWRDRAAVCIASGPSLTAKQCEQVRAWRETDGCRVVAINDCYLMAPFADILYFADWTWWKWHKDRAEFQAFRGQKLSIQNGAGIVSPEIGLMRNLSLIGGGGTMGRLSDQQDGIYTGQNSGYQAINIAVLKGVRRIVLIGYDMKLGPGGKTHWFGDHPIPTQIATFRQFRDEFARMAPTARARGIEILNATIDSDLEAFPRVALESLLPDTARTALPA